MLRNPITFLVLAFASPLAAFPQGADFEIYYDEWMVPHVFGDTDEAAFYGHGYHQMRDFPIGTIDLLWRFTGDYAEIAGEAELPQDRTLRLLDYPRIVESIRSELEALAPGDYHYADRKNILGFLQAYVDGVNAGRAWWLEGPGKGQPGNRIEALIGWDSSDVDDADLEMWFDPVPGFLDPQLSSSSRTADDARRIAHHMFEQPLEVRHVLSLGLAANSRQYLGISTPSPRNWSALTVEDEPLDKLVGSNGWAINDCATDAQTGTLTLIDGQTGLNRPKFRNYMVQIHGPNYQASGVVMPGYPAVWNGYNERVSWMTTASGTFAVLQNTWSATLDPLEPGLEFLATDGGGIDHTIQIIEEPPETLRYFDPATDTLVDDPLPLRRYYVDDAKDLASQTPGLRAGRHPITYFEDYPLDGNNAIDFNNAPNRQMAPGYYIEFKQTGSGVDTTIWELFMRLGMIPHAGAGYDRAVEDVMFGAAGGVLAFFIADSTSKERFRYLNMARIPRQGPAFVGTESLAELRALRDGSDFDTWWDGFHPTSELPQIIVNEASTPEFWNLCNPSADLVEDAGRFELSDLGNYPVGQYPTWMAEDASSTHGRLERAAELFRDLKINNDQYPPLDDQVQPCDQQANPRLIDRHYSEMVGAGDTTDIWLRENWDTLANDVTLTGDAEELRIWLNAKRHLNEEDIDQTTVLPNGGDLNNDGKIDYDFVAHRFSEVTVYTSLLKSIYYDLAGGLPATTDVAAAETAFEHVGWLWKQGSGTKGLRNAHLAWKNDDDMVGDSYFHPQPWMDTRFAQAQDPEDGMAGALKTRWGHLRMLVMTPHFSEPPAASNLPSMETNLQKRYYSSIFPTEFVPDNTVPTSLNHPYFSAHKAAVYPFRGGAESSHSIFTGDSKPLVIHRNPARSALEQGVYRWKDGSSEPPGTFPDNAKNYFAIFPHTNGNHMSISVELKDNAATGRFLAAFGGSEIVADLGFRTDDSAQPRAFLGADRFRPTGAFARGGIDDDLDGRPEQWCDLLDTKAELEGIGDHILFLTGTHVP